MSDSKNRLPGSLAIAALALLMATGADAAVRDVRYEATLDLEAIQGLGGHGKLDLSFEMSFEEFPSIGTLSCSDWMEGDFYHGEGYRVGTVISSEFEGGSSAFTVKDHASGKVLFENKLKGVTGVARIMTKEMLDSASCPSVAKLAEQEFSIDATELFRSQYAELTLADGVLIRLYPGALASLSTMLGENPGYGHYELQPYGFETPDSNVQGFHYEAFKSDPYFEHSFAAWVTATKKKDATAPGY